MDETLIQRLEEAVETAEDEEAEETAEELRIILEDYQTGLYTR